jgi:hypothetical protein
MVLRRWPLVIAAIAKHRSEYAIVPGTKQILD